MRYSVYAYILRIFCICYSVYAKYSHIVNIRIYTISHIVNIYAVCWSVSQCVVRIYTMLRIFCICYSVYAFCTWKVAKRLAVVAVCCSVLQCVAVCCSVLQCVAVCLSVLQCVAVCCSVSQCVAVCCRSISPLSNAFMCATSCCAAATEEGVSLACSSMCELISSMRFLMLLRSCQTSQKSALEIFYKVILNWVNWKNWAAGRLWSIFTATDVVAQLGDILKRQR